MARTEIEDKVEENEESTPYSRKLRTLQSKPNSPPDSSSLSQTDGGERYAPVIRVSSFCLS